MTALLFAPVAMLLLAVLVGRWLRDSSGWDEDR